VLLVLASTASSAPQALSETRYYFFLSDQRVVTVELVNQSKAILNYINLGDTFEVLQGPGLLLFDKDSQAYPGRFIEVEGADPEQRFKVSDLVSPHRYTGYTILGKFPEKERAAEVFLKVGSRVAELEEVPEEEFDFLAARIESMDLSIPGGMKVVTEAGFRRGYGVLHSAGSPRAEGLEGQFPDLRLLPPLILTSPSPRLPRAYSHLPDPVVVEVLGRVNRAGGITDLRISKGIEGALDDMARETVLNSWEFLPAVSDGKVAESELTLAVVFRRP